MHLPRPGLAGHGTREDGLHAEQQAQGDLPGDAVGCSTRRPPAGGGRVGGLPKGQPVDIRNLTTDMTGVGKLYQDRVMAIKSNQI